MLAEADIEKACSIAAQGMTPKPRGRRRPSTSTTPSSVDQSSRRTFVGSPHFWPRFLDICLVAAGVRCAVLLDSRRAPRRAPPLADVLAALQRERQCQDPRQSASDLHVDGFCPSRSSSGGGDDGCSIACLGLLVLDGSYFLVNREMLLRRLKEFACIESDATAAVNAQGFGRVSAFTTASGGGKCGVPRDPGEGEVVSTAGVGSSQYRPGLRAPSAVDSSATAQRHRKGLRRDFALVDVRKSLASPCDRSDVLAPRLYAALVSAFGDVDCDAYASGGAEQDPANLIPDSPPQPPDTTAFNSPRELAAEEERGARRWLHDWDLKEVSLDCKRLSDVLGGVGLTGLAGWLLEYPVIYCCPSLACGTVSDNTGDRRDCDDAHTAVAQGGPETEHAMGNCLAAAPLTVYSLSFDIGKKETTNCFPPKKQPGTCADASRSASQAFSFSVPRAVREDTDGALEGGSGITSTLDALVENFLEGLQNRIARHRQGCSSESADTGSCSRRYQPIVHGFTVTHRTETLDRVAL